MKLRSRYYWNYHRTGGEPLTIVEAVIAHARDQDDRGELESMRYEHDHLVQMVADMVGMLHDNKALTDANILQLLDTMEEVK